MRTKLSTLDPPAASRPDSPAQTSDAIALAPSLARRVRGEYTEMPGLRLTVPQAARLFGLTAQIAEAVLDELRRTSFLGRSRDGTYALIGERHDDQRWPRAGGSDTTTIKRTPIDDVTSLEGALKQASMDRLACLLRHWTWADEARTRFERELINGVDDEEDAANRPFGAYYHWCALLAGFGEAALDQALLPAAQLDAIRQDLESCLPELRSRRQILVTIPSSMEEQARVVDLLKDRALLGRLRRLHHAFGDAIRHEYVTRQVGALEP